MNSIVAQLTSPLKKALFPALKGLIGLCILAPFAVLMFIGGLQEGEMAFTVVGGLLSLGVLIILPAGILNLFVSPLGGYGKCPVCGSFIEAEAGDATELLCAGCGAYLDAKIDRLETIEPERVMEKPLFAAPTPWPDVRGVISSTIAFSATDYLQDKISEFAAKKDGVKLLNARWPAGCCVCGHPATRKEQYALPVTMAGAYRDTKATLVANDVPYCDKHRDGIAFERVVFNSGSNEKSYGILFRSHAYRESFRKLNPWNWAGITPKATPNTSPDVVSTDKTIVRCVQCSQQLRVSVGKMGTIKCPSCGTAFRAGS